MWMPHLPFVTRDPGALFQAVLTDELGAVNVRDAIDDNAQAIRRHKRERIVAATTGDNNGACGPQNDV
jgi:hypothetical protein